MKRSVGLLVIAFLLVPVLGAQETQKSGGDQEQQQPTLGPPAPGTAAGPRTATVTDYRKLSRMRSIYIERMDNALSEKLILSLGKMGRFKIAATSKEADAIMTGSCLESRRLKRLHSEVFIADRAGGSIWQDNIFRPFNPPSLDRAVNETAQVVADHLGESLNEAATR